MDYPTAGGFSEVGRRAYRWGMAAWKPRSAPPGDIERCDGSLSHINLTNHTADHFDKRKQAPQHIECTCERNETQVACNLRLDAEVPCDFSNL
jgi:hypothetical protein